MLQRYPSFPLATAKPQRLHVFQIVIHQSGQRRPLPPVPLQPLFPALRPQASQILPAGAHLEQLKFESLMLYPA